MYRYLDAVVITDTYHERAEKLNVFFSSRLSNQTDIILITPQNTESIANSFRDCIRALLSEKKAVMVTCNYHAALDHDVAKILEEAERDFQNGTRRLIISCHSANKIGKEFKKHGCNRGGFRHIKTSGNGRALEKIDQLLHQL